MRKTLATLCFGLFTSAAVSASTITYENRATDNGVNTSDYQSSWNAQTSSVFSRELEQFNGLRANGSNRNQHSHLSLSFDVSSSKASQDWLFQFSPDAGLGGEIYFDGNLVERDTSNLWWGYSWNRSAELLSVLLDDVNSGSHVLDVYWAENCCNGGQSGRFSTDNGSSWLALSTDNLDAVGVPEPGSLLLLSLGIAGLTISRRKSKEV